MLSLLFAGVGVDTDAKLRTALIRYGRDAATGSRLTSEGPVSERWRDDEIANGCKAKADDRQTQGRSSTACKQWPQQQDAADLQRAESQAVPAAVEAFAPIGVPSSAKDKETERLYFA
jgi:hypothetical protein